MTETPAAGDQFVSWTVSNPDNTSANCGTGSTCTVTFTSKVSGSAHVTANFEVAPVAPATTPTTVLPVSKALQVVPLAVEPGGGTTAVGHGCPSQVPVVFTIAGAHVGGTTSSTDGHFRGPVDTSDLAVGTYEVDAHCGLILTAPLDVVVAAQVGSDSASLIIIIFFILLGLVLFARHVRSSESKGAQR